MNEKEYRLKALEEQNKLIISSENIQKDLYNLKMMLYDIKPYSKAWRWGYIKTLKRTIDLVEKENIKGAGE